MGIKKAQAPIHTLYRARDDPQIRYGWRLRYDAQLQYGFGFAHKVSFEVAVR